MDTEQIAVGRSRGSRSTERDLILRAISQVDAVDAEDSPAHATTTAATGRDELPSDYFPGYDVQGVIHRGGQGVVYKAVQRTTGQKVAIKLLHGSIAAGPAGRGRFEREVAVLGQLEHPGIVRILDSGQTLDGALFCVMAYIAGRTLESYIKSLKTSASAGGRTRSATTGAPGLRGRLGLFCSVCEAVNAAHLKGVIHRDLKPANIKLAADGRPVVVDFGLAKLAVGESGEAGEAAVMTQTGQFVGSLPWASPEQAEGSQSEVDVRTDVYSLGVMLYQLVTGGRFPYKVVGTMREVMQEIVHTEPARPSTASERINGELETIVLKALAKDRARRYQNAGDLGRDVRRYLDGLPIEAKRDSGWYVVTKTLRRHRTPVGMAMALVVGGLVFTVMVTLAYARVDEERLVAAGERDRANGNFERVRSLARTVLYDMYDSVEHLRGAGPTREMMVAESTRYLAALHDQVRGGPVDPGLAGDIADGYGRLGEVLLDTTLDRDTTAEAAAALEESRRLWTGLASENPGDPRARAGLALAEARVAKSLLRQRRYGEAAAGLERALGLYAQVDEATLARLGATLGPADAAMRMGEVLRYQSRAAGKAGEAERLSDAAIAAYAEAGAAYDAASLRDPASVDAARGTALTASNVAQARLDLGQALIELAEAGGADADAEGLRAKALGAFERAERGARDSAAALARLSAAFPANRRLRRDEMLAWHNVGLSLAGAARAGAGSAGRDGEALNREALGAYRAALAVAEEMAVDRSDLLALRDVGVMMNKVGNQLRALGHVDEAAALYDTLVEHRREVYATDPTPRHRRDLALACFKRGEIEADLAMANGTGTDGAGPDGTPGARAAHAGRARELLEAAREHERAASAGGDADESIARAVAALLARLDDLNTSDG